MKRAAKKTHDADIMAVPRKHVVMVLYIYMCVYMYVCVVPVYVCIYICVRTCMCMYVVE